MPFLVWKPRRSKSRWSNPTWSHHYLYVVENKREGSKVKQKTLAYLGRPSHLGLKDLYYLLTGQTDFKDVEKWRAESGVWKLKPLCEFHGLDLKRAVKTLFKHAFLAQCARAYVVKHGIPATFRPIFDKYDLTSFILEEAKAFCQQIITYGLPFGSIEYFDGKPEDIDRVRQFLAETPEEQLTPK